MNANSRTLHILAGEPDAVMTAETAHTLVNRSDTTQIKLATVKRSLRKLRNYGLAEASSHYDRKRNRNVNHWFATPEGIRQDSYHR